MWAIGIIAWIVLSILAGVGARNKGRSFAGFFFLSLLLSPVIGLIAMAVAKSAIKPAEDPVAAEPAAPLTREVACPNCGKPKVSGSMCQACGSWAG